MRRVLDLLVLTFIVQIGCGTAAHAQRLTTAVLSDGPRIALVVSNGRYKNLTPLANPANDAALMASVLKRVGFSVDERYDLDRLGFERAVDEFSEKLRGLVGAHGPGVVGLVFYAGHGVEANSTNYLLPVDVEVRTDRDIEWQAVSVERMTKRVAEAGNHLNVFVLDACRNNPFRGTRSVGRRGLSPMGSIFGIYIASSTAAGDVASDGPGNNSPYTLALAEAVVVPGYKLEDVFKSVRRKVRLATEERQIPWESSSVESDFFFVPARRNAASDATGALPEVELDGRGLVVAIQSELSRTGCQNGGPTGEFDPQTVAGLRTFALVSDHKFHWHRPTMAALRALRAAAGSACRTSGLARSRCLRVNGESFCE
ncbi:MAG: caspase domain-containing protein [Hyphomicrobiaceae bacterium]